MVNQAAVIGKQASEKAAEGLWLEAAELFSAAMGAAACADPWCLSGRSECWAELERWEEALADAEQCVQISEVSRQDEAAVLCVLGEVRGC